MKRHILILTILFLVPASSLFGQEWARTMFETKSHDFGTIARNAKAEYQFVFSNRFEKDVHVVSATPSCGCTSTRIINPTAKTYETGAVVASLNSDRYFGQRSVTITVRIDKPQPAIVLLHVSTNIRNSIVFEPGSVNLGEVDQGNETEKIVTVRRQGSLSWQVVDVKSPNPHVQAEVLDTRRTNSESICRIRVQLDPDAPIGPIRGHLRLVTNDRFTPEIPLLMEGHVLPEVMVSPASLYLGVIRPGQKVTKPFVVRGKHPFRVLAISSDATEIEVDKTPKTASQPVHVIPVTFVASEATGKIVRTIRIETDLGNATPEFSTIAYVKKLPDSPSSDP